EEGGDRVLHQAADEPVALRGGAPRPPVPQHLMIPKTATKYSPDHFTAQAIPSSSPAARRQGRRPPRTPSGTGAWELRCICALASARRSRNRSRSIRSAPNAASAKNIRNGSSRLVREWT